MGYVTVTGGREAIEQAARLVQYYRLKDANEPLDSQQLVGQFRLLIDRVMSEGGLYAPEFAAIALKQAEGDPYEAAFLLRSYRSTLQRNHTTLTLDTDRMRIIRRISASFRDIPGGQILGPTRDYTHRLLDVQLREEGSETIDAFLREFQEELSAPAESASFERILERLRQEGWVASLEEVDEATEEEPFDITRDNIHFPSVRSARLQALTRGETGVLVSLAYSNLRGFGTAHATIGETRVGYVPAYLPHPYAEEEEEDEDGVYIGELLLTEVETVNSFHQDPASGQIVLETGFGLCFGHNEQKAIAMAILEYSLEKGGTAPSEDEEFVLKHIDGLDSGGIIYHLNMPHYVGFQTKLEQVERVREKMQAKEAETIATDDKQEV
ncbi:phosphonate metabolism [Paenibacillus terrae HPL-003]|uniref:Phosphonate metabolism n=1 Tax=Paenibacillus terrae (strain HPL-003) TaxID=985665 RepID=G7VPR2_PAETH|nr:carbon-phosphorus lyase complex subunit PhnI [Paenibacillus terrae]AET61060.1 phosphonate metabolism [Paenibacillus terrae HPL-003]